MSTTVEEQQRIEAALVGLGKLLRAAQFYPPEHPAFEAALQEGYAQMSPLAEGGGLPLKITRSGFFCEDTPIAPANENLRKLASFLFSRRVESLFALPGMTLSDLRELTLTLSLDPPELQNRGGAARLLAEARVRTLCLNELDPLKILKKNPPEEGRPGQRKKTPPNPQETKPLPSSLAQLLGMLSQPFSEERYLSLLKQAPRLSLREMNPAKAEEQAELATRLDAHSRAAKFTDQMRTRALAVLRQILTAEYLHLTLEKLCAHQLPSGTEKRFQQVLNNHADYIYQPLLEELALARDPLHREGLLHLVIPFAQSRRSKLLELLKTGNFPLQQVSLRLLGELRADEAVPELIELLQKPKQPLERDLLGTLARIGGEKAEAALLQMASSKESPLQHQAILALGAMKSQSACRGLLKLVSKLRFGASNLELHRTLVKALGQIGAPEAVPVLAKILHHRPFWNRSLWNDYRCTVARALAEIATDEARLALEKAAQDRNPRIANCAGQVLAKLKKSETL